MCLHMCTTILGVRAFRIRWTAFYGIRLSDWPRRLRENISARSRLHITKLGGYLVRSVYGGSETWNILFTLALNIVDGSYECMS